MSEEWDDNYTQSDQMMAPRGRGWSPDNNCLINSPGFSNNQIQEDDEWNETETKMEQFQDPVETSNGDYDSGKGDGWEYDGGGRRGGAIRGGGRGSWNGRGGGRGRGGGGRGGLGHFHQNNNNSNGDFGGGDSNENHFTDGNSRGHGRGRGRGRGGRGGFDRKSGDDANENKTTDAPPAREPVTYIPPEPSENEDDIFNGGISTGINFNNYDTIKVSVSGENVPNPMNTFDKSGLREHLLENIKKSNYVRPTPIQKYAVPIVISGRDVMACAQTGSGKTAAFLLPIIHTLLEEQRELHSGTVCQPHAVIIAPTRELAIQIHMEARKFAHGSIVKTMVTYGGTATQHQANQIARGCHILVATPGRLLDFTRRGRIKYSSLRFIVLDEADRMLDMGFLPDIETLMNHETMGERQTLMFSATFPEDIQRLAQQFLNNYIFLTVGIIGGACEDVEQEFHLVKKFDKTDKLLQMLSSEKNDKSLVFVETKRTADFIALYLSENSLPTTSIHGDRYQSQREIALADFKSGRCPILVATAVAARGLDIKGVSCVINFDLPKSIDEYVHRIGRTGRVGNRGKAISFYDPDLDQSISQALVTILKQANQKIPDWLENEVQNNNFGNENYEHDFGGKDVRSLDNNTTQVIEAEEVW